MLELLGNPTVLPFDMSRGKNPMGGKTYYVDCFESAGPPVKTKGNDNWEGTDPEFPLETLEAAYAKVNPRENDYIFVQNFWALDPVTPLNIQKSKLHIIGIGSGNFDNGNDIDGGATASLELEEPCQDLELAGFNLGGNGAAAAIVLIGTVFRPHIHHCTIGNNYLCTDGLQNGAGGSISKGTIAHCIFGNQISAKGVNCTFWTGVIAHNLFRQPGSECISIPGSQWVYIFDNMFFKPYATALAAGWAVHLDANTSLCAVMNNVASEHAADAPAVAPWLDDTDAGAGITDNGWAGNMVGNACTQPV